MRLSDAGCVDEKRRLIYLNHRPSPWFTEDAARDRSKQLLGVDRKAYAHE